MVAVDLINIKGWVMKYTKIPTGNMGELVIYPNAETLHCPKILILCFLRLALAKCLKHIFFNFVLFC
jgi:hypothetical protein